MNIRKRAVRGIAFCGLFLAVSSCARPAGEPQQAVSDPAAVEEYDPGCLEKTTLRIAGRGQVVTLAEAEQIRRTLETYLAEEKPDLEPSVQGPGKAFIDCQGTVRMGAWILEPAFSEKPELLLSYRVVTNDLILVRQLVDLALVEGRWKVTGVDVQTAHRSY